MAADASMKDNLDKLIESISQDSTMAVVLNKDGNILFANKELGRFLRCKPEEMAGKNWVENYIPSANREKAARIFQSIVSDSVLPVERYINTVLTARGEERIIYWQNGIVRDKQGGIIYVVIYGKDITERAQLEEVLLLSEKDKNIILNSLTDSIVYQDMDHRILWANEAAGKGVDERPENMIGQKCYRIIQKADRPCAGCPIILARTTGQPHELLHMNYFGKVFHLRAYPVFDENKQITGAVEISTDVTERQKADKTLVESEQRFRDIARAAAEFIWETDKQGRFSYLTDRAHIILDRKLSDILNHKSFDFMSPAEAKRMYKILAGYQSQKQPFYNLEHKFLRPDGSEIWVRVSGVPMFDTNGEFTGYRGAGAEITAEKNAGLMLKQWMERYNMISSASGQVAYDYHIASEEIIWGSSLESVTGYSPGQGMNTYSQWKSLLHPDDKKATVRYLNDSMKTCSNWDAEYRLQHKNGSYIWIRDRGFFICSARGKAIRQLGIIEDITASKEIEEKLRKTQKLLKDTQAITRVGGWEYDVKTRQMTWTDETYNIYGVGFDYDPSDITQDVKFYTEESQARVKEALRQAITKGKSYEIELEMVHQNGEHIWVRTIGKPIIENGRVVRVAGNIIDITERKLADEQVQILAGLADIAPAWITVHDMEGNFLYANQRTLESHGYTAEEFFKLNLRDIDTPENARLIKSRVEQILQQGEVAIEVTHKRKDGSLLPLQIFTRLIEWKGKKVILSVGLDITELKKTEQAFRESEQRFRDIAGAAAEFIWETNDKEEYTYLTDRAGIILDRPLSEILGHTPFEFMPPSEAQRVRKFLHSFIKNRKPFHNLEHRFLKPDGSEIWVLISGVPVINSEGKSMGFRGAGAEITAEKLAREALRESEEKYRKLFENANEGILIIQDRILVFLNPMITTITGYSTEELLLKHFIDLVHPDDKQMVSERYIRRMKGQNVPSNYSLRMVNKAGETRWISMNVVLINWNERPATLNFISDITTEKLAQEALRESEEKYRRLFENANEAIVIIQDGMIIFFNPMTNKITGYSDEELISEHFTNFIYADDLKLVTERYRRRMKGEEVPANYAFRLKHKSGEPRWVSTNIVMINWDGRPATLNLITDITDRKLLEEERQRVEKLESIGIMAGGIAHDFNNLLTAIIGNISLVKIIGKQDDDSLTILEDAEKASMRAKSLTQQLLTFAKGGAPVKKNMAIADLLKESAGFVLRGSNIKCQWSIQANLWNVEVDEGQINQVINNLTLNAQQSMPTGGTIEIKAENLKLTAGHDLVKKESLPEGNYIIISITDHGVGIPPEYLDKIFDPFFTTKQKGSGLGLATSYSIVKNHGGYINAESSPGSGTTFFVYLPASRKYKKRPSMDKSKHIPGEERVLIMDDEASVREVLGRMLKHMNYRDIVYAREGEEAVRLYKEGMETGIPFNIVILDLTIPGGMGGKETMEKLRKINPAVKAIVSSGYSTESIIAEYDKYGFSGVITKPYNIDQLRDILAEMGKSD